MSQLVVSCLCGTRMRGTPGKKVRCPKCKAVVAIPEVVTESAAVSPPAAVPASRSGIWIIAGSCVTAALAVGVAVGVIMSRRDPAPPTPGPAPVVVAKGPEAPRPQVVAPPPVQTTPKSTPTPPKVDTSLSDLLKGSEPKAKDPPKVVEAEKPKVDPIPEKPEPETPPAAKDDPEPKAEPKAEPRADDPVFTQAKAGGFAVETASLKAGSLAYKVRRFQSYKEVQRLRLAVTPVGFDNLGALLDQLGDGYRYDNITNEDIQEYERIKDYQVVFLTCAGGGTEARTKSALRKFVEMGGTLYASDLRYDAVVAAFPDYKIPYVPKPQPQKKPIAKNPPGFPNAPPGFPNFPGAFPPGFPKGGFNDPLGMVGLDPTERYSGEGGQDVSADVVDSGLKQFLGNTKIPLHFDSGGWRPALFDKSKSTSYLVGTYKTVEGLDNNARLLVKFRHRKGSVIFTSFHNANNSDVGKKLIEYLVFSAVNARTENDLRDLLLNIGFSLVDLKNVQMKGQGSRVEEKYNHLGGSLQVAVGYESLGARLRLVMESPDGERIEHEEPGTFMVEVPNARAGDWKISVVGSQVPFANFPFLMAIAKGR